MMLKAFDTGSSYSPIFFTLLKGKKRTLNMAQSIQVGKYWVISGSIDY